MKQVEILLRAKNYVDQLKDYIDPLTKQQLPCDSVFRAVAVHAAMHYIGKELSMIITHDSGNDRAPFAPDPTLRRTLRTLDRPLNLPGVEELLGGACNPVTHRALGFMAIRDYLVSEGYLRVEGEGKEYRVTDKGARAGISTTTNPGNIVLRFAPEAQQLLIDHLDDLAEFNRTRLTGKYAADRVKIKATESLRHDLQTAQALSRGLHPTTGQPLPESDPATQERLKTCFDYVAKALARSLELGYYSARVPFALREEEWRAIPVAEEGCSAGVLLCAVNDQRGDPTGTMRLDLQELYELLARTGAVALETTASGRKKPALTPRGEAEGVRYETRQKKDGTSYQTLVFSAEVQRRLIAQLERFVKD